jgi:DnaK suppressor protein
LQDERQQLLAGLAREDEGDTGTSDVADVATSRIEQASDDRERQRRRERVNQIEAALQRLDDGTWGTCASCGGKIAGARMQALPTADLCVDCASQRR